MFPGWWSRKYFSTGISWLDEKIKWNARLGGCVVPTGGVTACVTYGWSAVTALQARAARLFSVSLHGRGRQTADTSGTKDRGWWIKATMRYVVTTSEL